MNGCTKVTLLLAVFLGWHLGYAAESDAKTSTMVAFVVTFDGPAGVCHISRPGQSSVKTLDCSQVASYLVRKLKLPKASYFDYTTIADVNEPEFRETLNAIETAGYRATPGVHAVFLTEPHTEKDH